MQDANDDKPWFSEWFDENYRMLYRHRNSDDAREQVNLILQTLELDGNARILDLCCGEGRYTAILKSKGFRVFGLDLSKTLVKCGKIKEPHLDLVVGDMRAIPGSFDLILSLFTSFGYFDSDRENMAALASVHRALNPGGIYWLDFLNSAYVKKNLAPQSRSLLPSGVQVLEKRRIEDGRIIKDIVFKNNGEEKYYKESVRLFSRDLLEQMFQTTGFKLLNCFGDYRGNAWSPDRERTILVGEKRHE
jgi:SAM-dependent methyltransferase